MIELIADIGITHLLLIWSVVAFASVLRAFTGFGFALAAVPVFSLFLPPTESVVLGAVLTLTLSLMSLRTYWGVVPLRPLAPLLLMALLGTAVGAAVLTVISVVQFQLWAGLAVILACIGMTIFQPSVRRTTPLAAGITGLIAGLMNGLLAIPGPPLIIYAMLTEPQPGRSRALLMTILLVTALLGLASYGAAGFVELKSLGYFVVAVPALYAGNRLGNYLFLHFGDALYRHIALAALLAVGVTTILRALL
jgi:uncharacterized membrane protein YfcA